MQQIYVQWFDRNYMGSLPTCVAFFSKLSGDSRGYLSVDYLKEEVLKSRPAHWWDLKEESRGLIVVVPTIDVCRGTEQIERWTRRSFWHGLSSHLQRFDYIYKGSSANSSTIQGVIDGTSQTRKLQKPHYQKIKRIACIPFAVCAHGFWRRKRSLISSTQIRLRSYGILSRFSFISRGYWWTISNKTASKAT